MTIVRDGKEIELTDDELMKAYLEQQYKMDKDFLKEYFKEHKFRYSEEQLETAAIQYRELIRDLDMNEESAIDQITTEIMTVF